MSSFLLVLSFCCGLTIGALVLFIFMRIKMKLELATYQANIAREKAILEERLKLIPDWEALLEDTQRKTREAFSSLSAEALQINNRSFLELARTQFEALQTTARLELNNKQTSIHSMLGPIQNALDKVERKINEAENARTQSLGELREHLRWMAQSQTQIQVETSRLVSALRAPHVRGRWGEMQLKRVVELAGMVPYCDFTEQVSVDTESGKLRPDMVIHLPGKRLLVVDAKAPLAAYLEATEQADENLRIAKLKEHATQVRLHIQKLGTKAYASQFPSSPEFVVMFLPGEAFFSAALDQDPSLLEYGMEQKIILATPTTLIGLLKSAAYGWRQEHIAESARAIGLAGKELYERAGVFAEHLTDLGKALEKANTAYNGAVSSFESRLFVTLRRFKDFGVDAAQSQPIAELSYVEKPLREVSSTILP